MLENLNNTVISEEDFLKDFGKPVEKKELPQQLEEATQTTTTTTEQPSVNTQILQAASEIKTVNDASSKVIATVFDGLTNMLCNMIAGTDDNALYGMSESERKELENALKLVMPPDKVFGGKWLGLALVGTLHITNKAQKCYKQRSIRINRVETTQAQEQQKEALAAEMQAKLQALYYENLQKEVEAQAKEDAKKLTKEHEKQAKENVSRIETLEKTEEQKPKPKRKRRGQIGN